jgi:endonuclease-3 related protein
VYKKRSVLSDDERFEIVLGAILTQNVAWRNVEKALANLSQRSGLSIDGFLALGSGDVKELIRPAGFFNQKSATIDHFMAWFREYGYRFDTLKSISTGVLRDELLAIRGIGPETADSILLYSLRRSIFVVDAYTMRIFSRLGLVGQIARYAQVQELVEEGFRSDDMWGYNEFHALIVDHAKDCCHKGQPLCSSCCLKSICFFHTAP